MRVTLNAGVNYCTKRIFNKIHVTVDDYWISTLT